MTAIRLQRYLSQAGVAARRKAEDLITAGAVTVNGTVITKLGSKVIPGKDRVTVDGKAVYPQELFYAVLNKPKGCITAVSDPEGRATVMEYLHKVPVTIAPVGRLDFYSEGVLLLTNDGDLSARLQSPKYHIEKTYHVKIRGRVPENHLQILRDGVTLDDGTHTRPAQVDPLRAKSRHDWLVVTLTEGKSRQIHRMLDALGYTVLKIQRVAYSGITFHGLRVGDARELTQVEVNELRAAVGLAKSTVSRGKWSSRREATDLGRRARARARAKAEAEPERQPSRPRGKLAQPGPTRGKKPPQIRSKPNAKPTARKKARTETLGGPARKFAKPAGAGRSGKKATRAKPAGRSAKQATRANPKSPGRSTAKATRANPKSPGRSVRKPGASSGTKPSTGRGTGKPGKSKRRSAQASRGPRGRGSKR